MTFETYIDFAWAFKITNASYIEWAMQRRRIFIRI